MHLKIRSLLGLRKAEYIGAYRSKLSRTRGAATYQRSEDIVAVEFVVIENKSMNQAGAEAGLAIADAMKRKMQMSSDAGVLLVLVEVEAVRQCRCRSFLLRRLGRKRNSVYT